jgi:hypothetical protein
MTIFTTKRFTASAIVLTSAVFLSACSSYGWPGSGSTTASAQEGTSPAKTEAMSMEGMDMDKMSLDGLTDEEVRTKCMAMHQEMMGKMSEGGMMSDNHEHMEGMQHEDGMMMSPEMETMHERCMEVMPDMQTKHDRCMAMKSDAEGDMQQMHQNCMQMDDAASDETDTAPHSHDH